MVYLSIGNALGVLEQLCARISCRDVGAGGNGSRLPVCTWHGTWGIDMGAWACCRVRAAGVQGVLDVGTVGVRQGSAARVRKAGPGESTKPGQAEPELADWRCMASDGLIRLAWGPRAGAQVRKNRGGHGRWEETVVTMPILVRLHARSRPRPRHSMAWRCRRRCKDLGASGRVHN